jgi:hypothetical protein
MLESSTNSAMDELVLEGIVVTCGADAVPRVSPMGPIVDRDLTRFRLRPFPTSQTYQNLRESRRCVFHTTDDVELLARAAVGRLTAAPPMIRTPDGEGWILEDCCRWFELRADEFDDSQQRVEIRCSVVDQGRRRDFFGWNRAKHAVLEAAILATRIKFLSASEILKELARLQTAVDKTAGNQERQAMNFLREYLEGELDSRSL